MFGLSALGLVHTAISLIALAAGLIALIRDRTIRARSGLGRLYVRATVLDCLTGFALFGHGIGIGHVLGVVTLLFVALALWIDRSAIFGRASPYIQAITWSLTMLIQVVAGTNETLTRLPPGAPWLNPAGDPRMATVLWTLIAVFGVVMLLQMLAIRFGSRAVSRGLARQR